MLNMNNTYAIKIIIKERFEYDFNREWCNAPYYEKNKESYYKEFDECMEFMYTFFANLYIYYCKASNMGPYNKITEQLLDKLKEELSDSDCLMTSNYPCTLITRYLKENKEITSSLPADMFLFTSTTKTI